MYRFKKIWSFIMSRETFVNHIQQIQQNAQQNLHKGSITDNYELDVEEVCALLNSALATETVCSLRYKQHHYKALELGASNAAAEFLEHARQESNHADKLADRIAQLGGEPQYAPDQIQNSAHVRFKACENIHGMIRENLIAERIAIETYREMIQVFGDKDPSTKRILEDILLMEEEHADDLVELAHEYDVELQKH